MTTFNFIELFLEEYRLYFLIAIPIVGTYIWLANKLTNSWFNPLTFNVFTAGIGISVAVFLYYTNNASQNIICYIILSSVLYWGILLRFLPKKIGCSDKLIINEQTVIKPFFLILYILSIFSTLLSYAMFGIPLFNAMTEGGSRLETFAGSGGFGIILRLSEYPQIFCFFYLLHNYLAKQISFTKVIFYMIPFFIFGVLSGSRSSFIIYVFSFWGYKLFYHGEEVSMMKYKKLLIPVLIVSLYSFAVEHATDSKGAILFFSQRVVACGDLYWYALPYNTWENLSIKAPFNDLLVGLLAPLRVMNESSADTPIGYQLTSLVYTGFDTKTGPVELFPISSLAYFGYYGGFIMVAVQAFMTCYLVKLLFRKSNSLILSAFNFYAFNVCIYFVGSFRDGMGKIFDVLVNIAFIYLILSMIGAKFGKYKFN